MTKWVLEGREYEDYENRLRRELNTFNLNPDDYRDRIRLSRQMVRHWRAGSWERLGNFARALGGQVTDSDTYDGLVEHVSLLWARRYADLLLKTKFEVGAEVKVDVSHAAVEDFDLGSPKVTYVVTDPDCDNGRIKILKTTTRVLWIDPRFVRALERKDD